MNIRQSILKYTVILFVTFGCNKLEASVEGEAILDGLGEYLKRTVSTNGDVQASVNRHLRQLQLLREDGAWANDLIGSLFPDNVTTGDINTLIDRMIVAAKGNEYLTHSLNEMEHTVGVNEVLKSLLDREGAEKIPDAMAFAFVLNTLTEGMYTNIDVLRRCGDIWRETVGRRYYSLPRVMPLFAAIKIWTLNFGRPATQVYDRYPDGDVPEDYFHTYLKLNIAEARWTDWWHGFPDNVYVGDVLNRHPCGVAADPATGAGPTTFELNTKGTQRGVEMYNDLPQKWNWLYAVWNSAFVMREFPDWLYFLVKLWIPQVSETVSGLPGTRPGEYMPNRFFALITLAMWKMFSQLNGEANVLDTAWDVPEVWRSFGRSNRVSADAYERAVDTARGVYEEAEFAAAEAGYIEAYPFHMQDAEEITWTDWLWSWFS